MCQVIPAADAIVRLAIAAINQRLRMIPESARCTVDMLS